MGASKTRVCVKMTYSKIDCSSWQSHHYFRDGPSHCTQKHRHRSLLWSRAKERFSTHGLKEISWKHLDTAFSPLVYSLTGSFHWRFLLCGRPNSHCSEKLIICYNQNLSFWKNVSYTTRIIILKLQKWVYYNHDSCEDIVMKGHGVCETLKIVVLFLCYFIFLYNIIILVLTKRNA